MSKSKTRISWLNFYLRCKHNGYVKLSHVGQEVSLYLVRGQGEKAPQRPWDGAEGLEWEVPSPAPFHTYETPPQLNADATRVLAPEPA